MMEFNWFQYCPKCKTEKLTSEFRKIIKPGERNIFCKECRAIGSAKSQSKVGKDKYKGRYRKRERENALNYYNNNKDKHRQITKDYAKVPINKVRMNKIGTINERLRRGLDSFCGIISCKTLDARKILEERLGESINWPEFTKEYKIGFIIPLISFNILNKDDADKAFNINNLQLVKRVAPLNKIKYNN